MPELQGPIMLDAKTLGGGFGPDEIGFAWYCHFSGASVLPLPKDEKELTLRVLLNIGPSSIGIISLSSDAASTQYNKLGLQSSILAIAGAGAAYPHSPVGLFVTIPANTQLWMAVDAATNLFANFTKARA